MQYGVYVFRECQSLSAETVARATALDVPFKYPWSDLKRIKMGCSTACLNLHTRN
ncbi:hypothetical protein BDR05DRAFT_956865 [Suillus weaverae]|nr:hypothetical protein BDR05DRAFT_956865 [Suillus weaverae]